MIKSSLSASKYTFLLSVVLAASINNVMADNSTKVFSLQSNLADNSSFPPEYYWNQFGALFPK